MAETDIQIAIEADGWPEEGRLAELVRRTVCAAKAFLVEETGQPWPDEAPELSLLFTDDAAVREINRQWRGRDAPTNVLSFPATEPAPGALRGPMLGDIVLARETVAREADAAGKAFEAHLTHLLVHGFLHLFGYDHQDDGEAEEMEGIETRILAALGLSDPYRDLDPG